MTPRVGPPAGEVGAPAPGANRIQYDRHAATHCTVPSASFELIASFWGKPVLQEYDSE